MAFSLIPGAKTDCIYDLNPGILKQRGITLLLTDLDNTIAPYHTSVPEEALRIWARELEEAGITLFILSNSRKPNRARIFAESLGVPFLGHAGKPKRSGFIKAMAQMDARANRTAMLGDQIFTDILGANRVGILSILVKPIAFGTIFRAIRYGIETPFRIFAKPIEKG